MRPSSEVAEASSVHVHPVHVAPNAAVGFPSAIVTVSTRDADIPLTLVTVSITGNAPLDLYVCDAVGVVDFPPSPHVHAYFDTPFTSVEPRPSTVQARRTQVIAAAGVGGPGAVGPFEPPPEPP